MRGNELPNMNAIFDLLNYRSNNNCYSYDRWGLSGL